MDDDKSTDASSVDARILLPLNKLFDTDDDDDSLPTADDNSNTALRNGNITNKNETRKDSVVTFSDMDQMADGRATSLSLINNQDEDSDSRDEEDPETPDVSPRKLIFNAARRWSVKAVKNAGPEGVHVKDDTSSFFVTGRDFESVNTNHTYTNSEKELLAAHDSLDYLPPHSEVYKAWLRNQPARFNLDRWVMMALIGVVVGTVGYLLHQTVNVIVHLKWEKAGVFIKSDMLMAFAWVLTYSIGFTAIASFFTAFVWTPAVGSGIPEIIGFLNGTVVRHALNLRTFIFKFISCTCAVGAGLPLGPEGPMIHIGAIIGNGLSQFRSRTFGCKLPLFERLRNSEDRRNFTSAGAGAGVASAFGAPVGGLLFALEEVSSFWTMKLSWMIFFCCMVTTFSTDFLNSAFAEFKYWGSVGLFDVDKYIIFRVHEEIAVNVILFIPSALLGALGGLLGGVYTVLNLKIVRARRAIMSKITNRWLEKMARFLEPVIVMTILAALSVSIPMLFPCRPSSCPKLPENTTALPNGTHPECPVIGNFTWKVSKHAVQFTCPGPESHGGHNEHPETSGEYNELASILFLGGEDAVRNLFSRRTYLMFSYVSLVTALVIYFLLSCWVLGSSVTAGLVIPMLFIGGLYGRIVGRGMVDVFFLITGQMPTDPYWRWIDPGAFALIGAASFFGGVSRLTMSLTVIMMEITNDIQFLLPIMVSVMTAKWVGDMITHPLYLSLLELKCIPFLADEPVVHDDENKIVNLELHTVADIMTTPVKTLQTRESVRTLARLVLQNPYGGYPVVARDGDSKEDHLLGIITRNELMMLLTEMVINPRASPNADYIPNLSFSVLGNAIDRLDHLKRRDLILHKYVLAAEYDDVIMDISPFINQSSSSIQSSFSLHRTYIMFRTLGLRHLTVVDRRNRVVGIVSRKDMMGYYLEEKLDLKRRIQQQRERNEDSERKSLLNGLQ
ncbi:chloride channel protein B [Lingula anatina]|uniref:Chloride channel protein n=1 Tax=Lingula anatina TaxID=7574 RepID=A0A1S3IVW1_LINAN|nr:chloride channel protein B [Lingula anatina]|eukprot:XP_013401689.1 chloride channel protein B [Lingula anatina]